jgi:predicted amidohydrolase YtcJ
MRVLFAALAALSLTAPAQADTLIDNINGITMTVDGKVQRFKGIVIGADGKVVRLVTGNEPAWIEPSGKKRKKDAAANAAPRPDYRIDGGGRTLLPGMIDAHGHVIGLGLKALSLDLTGTKSLAEAKERIAVYAREHPSRRWIIGSGWNQELWGLGRFPTAADLADVGGDKAIWLERVDGHAGWANSAAMKAAGITATTASPAGGRIEKTGAAPNGIFVDGAMDLITKAMPQTAAKDRDAALLEAQKILLRYGITSIADMGTTTDDWLAFRRAGDRGALSVRIFSYAAGVEPMAQIGGGGPTPWLYEDRLRMAGLKLVSDGALGSRGAWLKRPYSDRPTERGLPMFSDTKLRNLIVRAAMDDFQIAIHAIGDGANAQILDAYEELAPSFSGDRRWRIEHAQILDPADVARFSKNGIIASMQPVHQTSDRIMAEARLGPDRLSGAYAWNSILSAGGKLAFGSDTPVENPNPFVGLAAAISREDEKGEPFGGWQPRERISREAALAAFTTGAAFAAFAEQKVGRLSPGMRADFILIDRDPLLVPPSELRQTSVLETWVGGKRAYTKQQASVSTSQ